MQLESIRQDFRLAWRQLSQRPGFSLAAVLTLAIGMGVNTVAFSVVNALLLKGSAAKDQPGVGRIVFDGRVQDDGNASLAEFQRIVEATRGVFTVAAEARLSVAWRHDGQTETAWSLLVSDQYFSMVDVPIVAGRADLTPVAGVPAVAIGERFWRERLQSRSLAGLTLRLNNVDMSVAGVIATEFHGPSGLYAPDVWIPLEARDLIHQAGVFAAPDARPLFVLARLQSGVTTPEAQSRLDTVVADMARERPETHRGRGARFRSFTDGNDERHAIRPVAAGVMGIIGLVLLLACFNVASLLLARAVEREREIGIRTALGAGRGRLTRMMITEGLMLASAAGLLTFVVARWAQALAGAFAMPVPSPQYLDLSPDRMVVVFIAALVLAAGVLPGLWPALAAARVNLSQTLGTQGGGMVSGRPAPLRRWLVTAQVAGSTAFLSIALLCVQLYDVTSATDLGFERERLVIAGVEPRLQGYDAARTTAYLVQLRDRVRALPGVESVAIADRVPFYIGYPRTVPVAPAGSSCLANDCPQVLRFAAGPGLFATLGRPLVAGREFDEQPTPQRAVLVNETFARQWWPAGRGLGQTLHIGAGAESYVVTGIVADVQQRSIAVQASEGAPPDRPSIFVPLDDDDLTRDLTIVARTSGPAASLVRPLVDAATAVDSNIPLLYVQTVAQRLELPLWPFRTLRGLFSICGLLALVLAIVGLTSVVSHAVSRRIREFGVRLSIGATPADLLRDVMRGAAAMFLPGLTIGLILAIGLAKLATQVMPGLDVWNARAYATVAVLQATVVFFACVGPAMRAARVDPIAALRA